MAPRTSDVSRLTELATTSQESGEISIDLELKIIKATFNFY